MPPTPLPYQRVIVQGIPYWKDNDGYLYYYESSAFPTQETRICLGTVAAGLYADWEERLKERLESYRATSKTYSRKPAASSSAS